MNQFVILLLCASPALHITPVDEVSTAIKQYNVQVQELKQNGEPPKAFQAPLESRNRKLRGIVKANADRTDLTVQELESIALACELIKEPARCVSVCQRAHNDDSMSPKLYQSWFRSLMNLGQRNEANSVLDAGIRKFGETSGVNDLHATLYFVEQKEGNFKASAEHAQSLVEYKIRLLPSEQTACISLVTFLERYVDAHQKSDQRHRAHNTMQRAYEVAAAAMPKSASEVHKIQLVHLMCELCRLNHKGDRFSLHVANLLQRQSLYLQQNPNHAGAHMLFGKGISYIADTCFALDQPRDVRKQLQAVIAAFENSKNKRLAMYRPRLNSLKELLTTRSQHRSIEGTKLPTVVADWIVDEERDDTEQPIVKQPRVSVVLFWAPLGSKALLGLEQIDRWEKLYSDQIQTQCIAPYCGFAGKTGETGTKKEGTTNAQEQSKMQQFLHDQEMAGDSHGMIDRDSPTWQALHVRFLPQVVLLDQQRRIKRIVAGLSPAACNELDREIEQLMADDGPTDGL